MLTPSAFGLFLKEKRLAAQLLQNELAAAIGKTGQYISNIEKGKNSAPPKEEDIEALIDKLALSPDDATEFRAKAAADRNQLPKTQMQYILSHPSLLRLIGLGEERNIDDALWEQMLMKCAGGTTNDIE